MKKSTLYLLIFLLCLSNCSISQNPPPGSNIIRPELDKYVGNWICNSGADEVVIQLKKINYYFQKSQFHEDIIVGVHKYIHNGNLVENYLPDFPLIGQNKLGTIFIYIRPLLPDPNKLIGTFVDNRKFKNEDLKIEFRTNSGQDELIWSLSSQGDLIVPPSESGLTLPSELVFRKM